MVTVEICVMLVLLLAARFLVPKMMYIRSSGTKFTIGICLFGIYTAVCLLMFRYLCVFDGGRIADLTGREVWIRVVCAFALVNLSAVIVAFLFFFTREKRRLSQEEKMKLKDL